MKKLLCVIISLVICCSLVIPVSAIGSKDTNTDPPDICNIISNELSIFEENKDIINMENVNFDNLYIGEEMSVYEYTQNGFESIATAFLIFEDNQIVSLAYKFEDSKVQIMTKLADSIKQTMSLSGTIVYDSNGCYFYNGTEFILLGNSDLSISERKSISQANSNEISELTLSSICISRFLNYKSNVKVSRTLPQNVFCSVEYVTQKPYNKICWAANIAMIVNCLKGTDLDAPEVAKQYFGSNTDFNHTATLPNAISFMNVKYGLNYTYSNYIPSDGVIFNNISSGYPIFAAFVFDNNVGHAATIYGANALAGRIMIMDPAYGSITCYTNDDNVYNYVAPYSGKLLTMIGGACKTW